MLDAYLLIDSLVIKLGGRRAHVEKTNGESSGSCPEEVGSIPTSTLLGKKEKEIKGKLR